MDLPILIALLVSMDMASATQGEPCSIRLKVHSVLISDLFLSHFTLFYHVCTYPAGFLNCVHLNYACQFMPVWLMYLKN